MANNYSQSLQTATTTTFASDDVSGVHYPIQKVAYGAEDEATSVSTTNPLPVKEQYAPAYEDNTNGVAKVEQRGLYSYQSTAGADKVIKSTAGFLYGIIIGKDVATSTIKVSDHASDGDANVKIYLEGSTLMTSTGGYIPVNASFAAGICADLTNQTHVTFIFR